jgi:hypothetical protein
MIECLYFLSLAIVVSSAAVIALHPGIPGGWFGTLALGGVAVCGLAGFDRDQPEPWLVGFMCSLAMVCVWALTRWRMEITRRLANDCTKIGGTD